MSTNAVYLCVYVCGGGGVEIVNNGKNVENYRAGNSEDLLACRRNVHVLGFGLWLEFSTIRLGLPGQPSLK